MIEDDDDRLRLIPPLCAEIGSIMDNASSFAVLFGGVRKSLWPEELARLEAAGRQIVALAVAARALAEPWDL